MKTKSSEANRRLIGLIAKYQRLRNATDEQVADVLGITRVTYSRSYKNNPIKLSAEQLLEFKETFGVPAAEAGEAHYAKQ